MPGREESDRDLRELGRLCWVAGTPKCGTDGHRRKMRLCPFLDIKMSGDSLEEGCQREFPSGEQTNGRQDGILYHSLQTI